MPVGPLRLWGFVNETLLEAEAIHAVLAGGPDRSPGEHGVPHELTILSWNIASGRRLNRVIEVLRQVAPDVCLLQEVDVGCRRSGFLNIAATVGHELGMHWLFAGEFQEIGQGRRGKPAITGQAILSRTPFAEPGVIPFSRQATLRWQANPVQPRRGGRMALWATTASIRVYNLHVESGKNDAFRQTQVHDVTRVEQARTPDGMPVVVAGDFNCGPCGHAPLLDTLRAHGFDDPFDSDPSRRRTSVRHRHALDWLFVRGLTPVTAAIVHHNEASDHFPVVVRARRTEGGARD